MIYIRQLLTSVEALLSSSRAASKEFDDPFYIAWMVDTIFNGKAPPKEKEAEFVDVMAARRSQAFRQFWAAYKDVNTVLENFQTVSNGIVAANDRVKYQKKFMSEHQEEVPF